VGVDKQRAKELRQLERVLGVRFRKLPLLNRALVSAKTGAVPGDNETLEFLGDSVIGLVIAEELFKRYPDSEVGDLAKIKAQIVSRATLGEIATSMELDRWMLMGPGEAARGEAKRPSIIGSAFEAVIGAIFLDRGLDPATKLIKKLFHLEISAVESGQSAVDYKSLLQEYALRYFKATPEYRLIQESGPGHKRVFQVSVGWRGKSYGNGSGPSKKIASQEAARAALEHLLAPIP
jgi:ribonuclease-3